MGVWSSSPVWCNVVLLVVTRAQGSRLSWDGGCQYCSGDDEADRVHSAGQSTIAPFVVRALQCNVAVLTSLPQTLQAEPTRDIAVKRSNPDGSKHLLDRGVKPLSSTALRVRLMCHNTHSLNHVWRGSAAMTNIACGRMAVRLIPIRHVPLFSHQDSPHTLSTLLLCSTLFTSSRHSHTLSRPSSRARLSSRHPFFSCRFLSSAPAPVPGLDTDSAAVDVEAAYKLGCAYCEGRDGQPRDYKLALIHFTTAATQHHAPSQARLGTLYLLGYGAPRDLTSALTFLTRAAAQHNTDALHTLASLHYRGVGVPRDHKQAAVLWKRASEAGHAKAAVRYAVMSAKGEGRESRQLAEAVQWLERGVVEGDPEAQYVLGMLLAHRQPYRKTELPKHSRGRTEATLFQDVVRDERRSLQLLHAAASANHVPALTALGDHYSGHSSHATSAAHTPNYQQAVTYYAQAADHADIHAQSRLAFLILNSPPGLTTPSTSQSPLVLLSTAAEGGIVAAQLQLIASAWWRGQESGGVLGKLRLKVDEVMKEYGAKVWDGVEREKEEWSESERARLDGLRERPEAVVQWLEVYEREEARKWMGDVHELLAVVERVEPVPKQPHDSDAASATVH